jgi:hypothetical protein
MLWTRGGVKRSALLLTSSLPHRRRAGRLRPSILQRIAPRADPIQQEIEQRPVKPAERRHEHRSYPHPHPQRERHECHATKRSCRVNAGRITKSSHSCDRFANFASPWHSADRHASTTRHDRRAADGSSRGSGAQLRGLAHRGRREGAGRHRRHGVGRERRGWPWPAPPCIEPAPVLCNAGSAASRREGSRARQGGGGGRAGLRAAIAA